MALQQTKALLIRLLEDADSKARGAVRQVGGRL